MTPTDCERTRESKTGEERGMYSKKKERRKGTQRMVFSRRGLTPRL